MVPRCRTCGSPIRAAVSAKQVAALPEQIICREVVMPRERADRDRVIVLAHVAEPVQAAKVHEQRGSCDAKTHGGNQRVPTGQELCVLAPEQLDGVLDRVGDLVVEAGWDHDFAS